jgi:hypothetical protein
MLVYLTYAEPPSGVYSSQVADVIRFINSRLNGNIRLIAFISLHDFSASKAKIKKELPDAIVLPAIPKAGFWKINAVIFWMLCLVLRPSAVIARNVIAANIALKARKFTGIKRICFDGRGAIAAEWHEYDVTVVDSWKRNIHSLESRAIMESDFRIAVTEKLVDYWHERYGYSEGKHVVIPCTLNSSFKAHIPKDEEKKHARTSMGLSDNDIVLAYSGSIAGWQSFPELYKYIRPFLTAAKNHKIVFLAKEEENISRLEKEFPGQIIRKWVSHHEVPEVLAACDMGILIREQSITNKVASPTKFAEYLSAGLPVLISEGVGDYTEFVKTHDCGMIANGQGIPTMSPSSFETRTRMIELVKRNFTKESQFEHYKELIKHLN